MQAIQSLIDRIRQALSNIGSELTGPSEQAQSLLAMQPRVLLITFDPVVDAQNHVTLSRQRGWRKVDELTAGYIADIAECSGGLINYQVVERHEVDEFPVKADKFTYTAETLTAVMDRRIPPHSPDWVDYQRIIDNFNLYGRIANNEIDEVWWFGFPYAGFYESRMCGRGAFWCNAPAMEGSDVCPRRFVIMGFSYERGVGEMLESFGHRVESTLKQVYIHKGGEANLWDRYMRHEKTNPGMSEVGTLHYAPNSDTDYDWGNRRMVTTKCDDWYKFPDFKGITKVTNCAEWGNGEIRAHHKWWLDHLPKLEGTTDGIGNNWWAYAVDPNNVAV